MCFTNDPIADFNRWDAEQAEYLDKLPKCSECKEPIQQDDAVCVDGKYICDNCLEDLRVELLQDDDWGDDG